MTNSYLLKEKFYDEIFLNPELSSNGPIQLWEGLAMTIDRGVLHV